MNKKEKTVKEAETLPFKPELGWIVSNPSANVFMDVVTLITPDGFICKQTGLWTGTTSGWIAHKMVSPKEELEPDEAVEIDGFTETETNKTEG
jgi:hypothetical protein